MTVVVSLAFVLVAVPVLAAYYLTRLPYAPECPHCRSVTSAYGAGGVVDRLCSMAAATPVRSCTRCGWAGRMRWKLAPERAATRHR